MQRGALTPRRRQILESIVKAYIQSGQPVGSQVLARLCHQALSPASLRHEMSTMAEEGYLSQPHTSAGRVPTLKAFQEYVRPLEAGRLSSDQAERIRGQFSGAETIEERLERCSHILTELTHGLGIAAAIPPNGLELEQIELVPLPERRVLMILVTGDHAVHNRVVTLDESLSPDELTSIRNYVNRNFSGWRLEDARRELLRRMAEERTACDAVLRRLTLLYQKGLLEVASSPELRMEGASNLIGLDVHLTRERMRDLLQALEQKQRILEVLDRFIEQSNRSVAVQVGLEEIHPALKEMALIGIGLMTAGGVTARLAVLGPIRMHYQKAMAAVLHTGRALERC